MQVIKEEGSAPIKIWTDYVEDSALKQLKNLAKLPFIAKNGVACMPDVHAGIGSTVGSVIATHKAIIPAAVGVDIGCGMNAVRTSLMAEDLPDSLAQIRHSIERGVPLGPGGAHKSGRVSRSEVQIDLWVNLHRIGQNVPQVVRTDKARDQLGSLGSGNHFIEVCLDEEKRVWVMLHSGSRGTGNIIGRHYISLAKELMETFHISVPDPDLAYLPEGTPFFDEYIHAMTWAQDYALENRRVMMIEVLRNLEHHIKPFTLESEGVNCHHNYAQMENHFGQNLWVTRKGAVQAREGDLGIIPGSMGQRSYIVRGKGNPESYHSCSHGAGRAMSRTAAKAKFTVDDVIAQTKGVECRKDASVIDEIPGSYKDIDQVMANQTDLVEVVHTLKQVLCVKGN